LATGYLLLDCHCLLKSQCPHRHAASPHTRMPGDLRARGIETGRGGRRRRRPGAPCAWRLERGQLLVRQHDACPAGFAGLDTLVRRRERREPTGYIIGHREFWNLDIEVGPGVLVPRRRPSCSSRRPRAPQRWSRGNWTLDPRWAPGPARLACGSPTSGPAPAASPSPRPLAAFRESDRDRCVRRRAGPSPVANAVRHDVSDRVRCVRGDCWPAWPGPSTPWCRIRRSVPAPDIAGLAAGGPRLRAGAGALGRLDGPRGDPAPSSRRGPPCWVRAAGCCSSSGSGRRRRPRESIAGRNAAGSWWRLASISPASLAWPWPGGVRTSWRFVVESRAASERRRRRESRIPSPNPECMSCSSAGVASGEQPARLVFEDDHAGWPSTT